MNADVILILPVYNVGLLVSHGMQYISASLAEHGIAHRIEVIERTDTIKALVAQLLDERPRVVGISATSFEYARMRDQVARQLQRGASTIILGGVHALLNPALRDGAFDYVCTSEAEHTFWTLCRDLIDGQSAQTLYPGFTGRNGSSKELPRVPEDLDTDLPDYLMGQLQLERIITAHGGWLNVQVSRGCPYQCSFCVNPVLRKLYPGRQYCRRMSPSGAIQHLERLRTAYPAITVFNFDDDDLSKPTAWFDEFLSLYRDRIFRPSGIRAVFNARPTHVDATLVENLLNAGCCELQMSVETGDELTRRIVLRKEISDEVLRHAFGLCREAGLRTLAYVMHGIPFSPADSPERLAALFLDLKPTLIRGVYCYPFAQSELLARCEQGCLPLRPASETVFDMSSLSRYDGDRQRFELLLADEYEHRPANPNYLWKRDGPCLM